MRVSEIHVKRIRVNQGLGVFTIKVDKYEKDEKNTKNTKFLESAGNNKSNH